MLFLRKAHNTEHPSRGWTTWCSFHSWVDWSNVDKVSCSRKQHTATGVRTVYLCIQNRHSSQPTNMLNPMAQKSLRRPTQWMVAMSCRRPNLSGPSARRFHTGFICGGFPSPCGAAGERSEFDIKPPLGAPLLIFPRGHLLMSFLQVDTYAR